MPSYIFKQSSDSFLEKIEAKSATDVVLACSVKFDVHAPGSPGVARYNSRRGRQCVPFSRHQRQSLIAANLLRLLGEDVPSQTSKVLVARPVRDGKTVVVRPSYEWLPLVKLRISIKETSEFSPHDPVAESKYFSIEFAVLNEFENQSVGPSLKSYCCIGYDFFDKHFDSQVHRIKYKLGGSFFGETHYEYQLTAKSPNFCKSKTRARETSNR